MAAGGPRRGGPAAARPLGAVSFCDRGSGLCKRGVVLPDGRIRSERAARGGDCETFDSTLEWLEDAPFLQPRPEDRAALTETARLACDAIDAAAAAAAAGQDDHAADPDGPEPRGRRRSRSVQGPNAAGAAAADSVFMLNSVEDDWNEWCRMNDEAAELHGYRGDNVGDASSDEEDSDRERGEEDCEGEGAAGARSPGAAEELARDAGAGFSGGSDDEAEPKGRRVPHGVPRGARRKRRSETTDSMNERNNAMVASRLVFGTKCDRICLFTGDPTALLADGVVRSCSEDLLCSNRGPFWDHAFARAGQRLLVSCEAQMVKHGGAMKPGQVVVTPAFELPAKYILHASVPAQASEAAAIRAAYERVLDYACEAGYKTIVLPFIGDEELCPTEVSANALVQVLVAGCQDQASPLWDLERLVVACVNDSEKEALFRLIQQAANSTLSTYYTHESHQHHSR